jgi:hypothetical protein
VPSSKARHAITYRKIEIPKEKQNARQAPGVFVFRWTVGQLENRTEEQLAFPPKIAQI